MLRAKRPSHVSHAVKYVRFRSDNHAQASSRNVSHCCPNLITKTELTPLRHSGAAEPPSHRPKSCFTKLRGILSAYSFPPIPRCNGYPAGIFLDLPTTRSNLCISVAAINKFIVSVQCYYTVSARLFFRLLLLALALLLTARSFSIVVISIISIVTTIFFSVVAAL